MRPGWIESWELPGWDTGSQKYSDINTVLSGPRSGMGGMRGHSSRVPILAPPSRCTVWGGCAGPEIQPAKILCFVTALSGLGHSLVAWVALESHSWNCAPEISLTLWQILGYELEVGSLIMTDPTPYIECSDHGCFFFFFFPWSSNGEEVVFISIKEAGCCRKSSWRDLMEGSARLSIWDNPSLLAFWVPSKSESFTRLGWEDSAGPLWRETPGNWVFTEATKQMWSKGQMDQGQGREAVSSFRSKSDDQSHV